MTDPQSALVAVRDAVRGLADASITLRADRKDIGTRVLVSGHGFIEFGNPRPGYVPPAGARTEEYHWGRRVSNGALVLLRGPDPRTLEFNEDDWVSVGPFTP